MGTSLALIGVCALATSTSIATFYEASFALIQRGLRGILGN